MKTTFPVTAREVKKALAAAEVDPEVVNWNGKELHIFVFSNEQCAEVLAKLEKAAAWLNERGLTNRAKFPGLKDPYAKAVGRVVYLSWAA